MFEKASRLKLRFDTAQGKISVEDLWDLPLTSKTGRANLDDLAKALNRQVKSEDTEESFVVKSKTPDTTNKIKFELVKHVIEVRLAEADEASKATVKKEQKQRLLSLIDQKRDEELSSKSIDELSKMIAEM